MKKKFIYGWIFIVLCIYTVSAQQRVLVNRASSKPIGVDGYLMEWASGMADTVTGNPSFVIDVMKTPAGLAGYVLSALSDSCTHITIQLYPDMRSMHRQLTIHTDTVRSKWPLYALDRLQTDTSTTVVAEWMLQWDSLYLDSLGQFNVGLVVYSACGDTSQSYIFYGSKLTGRRSVGRRLVFQVIGILALFIVYIGLKARVKRVHRR